ncbi:MAG: ATP-binding cassette domain-containing protein [Lachnospiraceae bacterium]|nr:ATP-binding cassette domain-containing protein [Lachnospiraceae bacterium]
MEYIIEVNDVVKKFKDVTVLDHVSLKVEKGTICGLVGRNGSGKTVLMKVICGFILPDSGQVSVDGKRIGKDCDFPKETGVIIENPGFSQYISGAKNLRNLASINQKISQDEIARVMELVGLNAQDRKWVSKYSLGMRQRLGIAQAIMEGQSLLILDEPMNGLDQEGVEDMRKLFQNLREQGKTILLASHSREDIAMLCDEVYEMEHGVIRRKDV